MQKTMLGFLLALLGAAAPVAAQEGAAARGGRAGWSVLSGSAVGWRHLALHGQAGWPELSVAGLYGLGEKLDVGLRVSFAWGRDGSLGVGPGAAPGFRVQAGGRYEMLRSGALRLGISFWPGFGMDYLPGLATPRILLPLALTVGLAAGDPLTLHFGLDLPAYVTPGTFGGLTVPILVGGGAEYRLGPSLVGTGQLRMGPALELTRSGAPARFAMQLLVGLAYRT